VKPKSGADVALRRFSVANSTLPRITDENQWIRVPLIHHISIWTMSHCLLLLVALCNYDLPVSPRSTLYYFSLRDYDDLWQGCCVLALFQDSRRRATITRESRSHRDLRKFASLFSLSDVRCMMDRVHFFTSPFPLTSPQVFRGRKLE
jgi:hypothetical protein